MGGEENKKKTEEKVSWKNFEALWALGSPGPPEKSLENLALAALTALAALGSQALGSPEALAALAWPLARTS